MFSGRDGSLLLTLDNPEPDNPDPLGDGPLFGRSVAGAGDVDGNGAADLLVGAPLHDAGTSVNTGQVHLFLSPDPVVPVQIDVEPGDARNRVNLNGGGPSTGRHVRVGVLTTAAFDAASVDAATVRFGPAGAPAEPDQSRLEDLDGDGDLDLFVRFRVIETGIALGDTRATLTGRTLAGRRITGTDTIVTVGNVAHGQSVTTNEDTPVAITLTATSPWGDPLTFEIVDQPRHGALSGTAPDLTYTPEANFNGDDRFTFRAFDGLWHSNNATVSITVNPVNDAPVAANDAYAVTATFPLRIGAPGVLGNDADVDGDTLSAVLVSGPASPNGLLTLNPDGSFTYTHTRNVSSDTVDTFTYKASDGLLDSNTATVSITVRPRRLMRPPTLSSPLNGARVGTLTPRLQWNAFPGATGYWVQLSASATFEPLVLEADGLTGTFFDVTAGSLGLGQTYYWRVTARNDTDLSPWSRAWTFRTPAGPSPAAPSGLNAVAVSSTQVDLAWTDNSGDELGFRLERKTGADGAWAAVRSLPANANSASDRTARPGTTYFYRVYAFNVNGPSDFSNEASATTPGAPAPPPRPVRPPRLSWLPANGPIARSILTPTLDWTDVAGATSYTVQVSTSSRFTTLTVNETATLSAFAVPPGTLTPLTRYFVRVKATLPGGDTAWSGLLSFTTGPGG